MNKQLSNEQHWKLLVLILRKAAELKGVSQQEIANRTDILRTNINRIFQLKHRPNLVTFVKIYNAIGLNFLNFEDKEGVVEPSLVLEDAMRELENIKT